jgi:hypothetical protein
MSENLRTLVKCLTIQIYVILHQRIIGGEILVVKYGNNMAVCEAQ